MIRVTIKTVEGCFDWGKNEQIRYETLDINIPELEKRLRDSSASQYGYCLPCVVNIEVLQDEA